MRVSRFFVRWGPAHFGMTEKIKFISAVLITAWFCFGCDSEPAAESHPEIIHPKTFSMTTCWLSDTK